MNRTIVVMGVSGAGKSTVGSRLAAALDAEFLEADGLHPPQNIAKMAAGIPLTDEDRWPWLDAVRAKMDQAYKSGEDLVVACSALKASYRRRLSEGLPDVRFVYLHAPPAVLRERLLQRRNHFVKADLLESQFETLEPPHESIAVDVGALTVEEAVRAILRELKGATSSAGMSPS